jgi:molybdate transport system substrate-binding protein
MRTAPMLAGVLALLLLTSACGSKATSTSADSFARSASAAAASPQRTPATGELTVFAAASLTESFNQIKSDLEAANPGLSISYNFAGSQALVTQLTQGAKADLFASANTAQMQTAQDGGVIEGEPTRFVSNKLAIIVPKDNPAGITGPGDLAKDDVKLVVGNPDVPVGTYFLQVLDNMAADPTFGAGVKDEVLANVVSQESDVKQVVSKVQLGEADAGVVYVTDVTPDVAPDVTIVAIPDAFNVVAVYPIAAVKGGNAERAQFFIDYLLSPAGQRALTDAGFTSP